MKKNSFPNLFIVGQAKAGTTSLANLLAKSSLIDTGRQKETHFFSQVSPSRGQKGFTRFVTRESDYLKNFTKPHPVVYRCDASPSYLNSRKAAIAIKSTCPDAKIVIAYRDPIDRAYSHFMMDVREGMVCDAETSFLRALKNSDRATMKGWGISPMYTELGFASDAVLFYEELFGSKSVLLISFDTIVNSPEIVADKLSSFLELDLGQYWTALTEQKNERRAVRSKLTGKILSSNKSRLVARALLPHKWTATFKTKVLQKKASSRTMPSQDAIDYLVPIYNLENEKMSLILERKMQDGFAV